MFDLFGDAVIRDALLRDRFIEPPFSILDTRGARWQARKRQWIARGIKGEETRDGIQTMRTEGFASEKYGRAGRDLPTVSIFDPALCELIYSWYCVPGGRILDPFAGGPVRGIVAGYLNFSYIGIDVRRDQIIANYQNLSEIFADFPPPFETVRWACGDSCDRLDVRDDLVPLDSVDLIFSCPPYWTLENYSDLAGDLSNMPFDIFCVRYASIIHKAIRRLKEDSFAVFVVSDIRDAKGFLIDLTGLTKRYFKEAGAPLYSEAIMVQPYGTAAMRASKTFGTGKKLIKVHEHVLIFYKGNPENIKAKFYGEGSMDHKDGAGDHE